MDKDKYQCNEWAVKQTGFNPMDVPTATAPPPPQQTRRRFSAEEKIRIVLDGLRGELSVAKLCRREGIAVNLYYRWSKDFLEAGKKHTRGRPYHPQTQGKIERYHRSMKSVVKLQHYYFPWELEAAVRDFVAYYNHRRYHESLDNGTPADVYYGRHQEVLSERDKIKQLTMQGRKKEYRAANAA